MPSTTFTQVAIDDVRQYWNRRPCNIRHSQRPMGTKEYFDDVEHRKYFVEPHIPGFANFEQWRGKKVLELGCGIGTDTINFARHGASVTAVDLSERSLEIAKRRAEVYGLESRVKFYLANIEDLKSVVPVDEYDLIYSFGVIHHTPNPENVLQGIRQYVKADTVLKLMVYHRYATKVPWIILTEGHGRFWRAAELVAAHSEAQTGCPVTYTYTPRELAGMLNRFGFKVVDSSVEHIFAYRIPDYVKYRYRKVWYYHFMPGPLFRWLERRFGWHLCVTAIDHSAVTSAPK